MAITFIALQDELRTVRRYRSLTIRRSIETKSNSSHQLFVVEWMAWGGALFFVSFFWEKQRIRCFMVRQIATFVFVPVRLWMSRTVELSFPSNGCSLLRSEGTVQSARCNMLKSALAAAWARMFVSMVCTDNVCLQIPSGTAISRYTEWMIPCSRPHLTGSR